MVTTFKGFLKNVYNHNGAKHEKTTFFKKKIYKGLYKVKMDIYKCPNPKKFLKYILEKREILPLNFCCLFLFLFRNFLTLHCHKNVGPQSAKFLRKFHECLEKIINILYY